MMLIFWCLFAFVGSGFEHSIANQSVLGIALFLPHGADISWAGFVWNQVWAVLGNVVGGAVFMGGAYWFTSPLSSHASEIVVCRRFTSSHARDSECTGIMRLKDF